MFHFLQSLLCKGPDGLFRDPGFVNHPTWSHFVMSDEGGHVYRCVYFNVPWTTYDEVCTSRSTMRHPSTLFTLICVKQRADDSVCIHVVLVSVCFAP